MKYSNPKIPEGINTSEEHPLKEFALLSTGVLVFIIVLVMLIGAMLDWATRFIPFSYEQHLATPIIQEFSGEKGIVDDYLQTLVDEVAAKMDLPEEMTIQVQYVNQDVVNAMATLGGNIFVYRGLLEKLPSENALMMLLAHEIAHVKLRHPLKSLNKGLIINLLIAMIGGQASSDVTSLLSDTSLITLLSFSRSQEQDADYEAAIANYRLYNHMQGAFELFNVLEQESLATGFHSVQFLQSHPEIKVRNELVSALAASNQYLTKGATIQIPDKILEKLKLDKLAETKDKTES